MTQQLLVEIGVGAERETLLRELQVVQQEHEEQRQQQRHERGIEGDAEALGDEAADVLGMLLIYCDRAGIDLEAAMQRKWLKWLEPA